MRLTIAYSKMKKRNLVLINKDTHERETLSERPIRQPLKSHCFLNNHTKLLNTGIITLTNYHNTFYMIILK